MSCFFGHKFGRVELDGYQYCSKCGAAKKPSIPHPCCNGHMWVDYRTEGYTHYSYEGEQKKEQIFQTCKVCGEKRTTWQY